MNLHTNLDLTLDVKMKHEKDILKGEVIINLVGFVKDIMSKDEKTTY